MKELVLSVNECPSMVREQKMELSPASDLFIVRSPQECSKVAGCTPSEETARACPGELGEHEGHSVVMLSYLGGS